MMPRTKLATRIRQEQIAEAALEVVAERGSAGLSVAAVAERVGIVPSAIYRHFGGKEAVLDAVVDLLERRLRANLDAVRGASDRPLDQLHQVIQRHVAMVQGSGALPRLLFAQVIYGTSDDRRSRMGRVVLHYLKQIEQIIREGQRAGEVRAEVDPAAAAVVLLGMVQFPVVLWQITAGEFDVADQINKAWPLFKQALTADRER